MWHGLPRSVRLGILILCCADLLIVVIIIRPHCSNRDLLLSVCLLVAFLSPMKTVELIVWARGTVIYRRQGQTNTFAAASGDKMVMRPFVITSHHLLSF